MGIRDTIKEYEKDTKPRKFDIWLDKREQKKIKEAQEEEKKEHKLAEELRQLDEKISENHADHIYLYFLLYRLRAVGAFVLVSAATMAGVKCAISLIANLILGFEQPELFAYSLMIAGFYAVLFAVISAIIIFSAFLHDVKNKKIEKLRAYRVYKILTIVASVLIAGFSFG